MTAGPQDTCNAQTKDRGRQHICELPLGHQPETHVDGDYTWTESGW